MDKNNEIKSPLLMVDSSEKDGKAEIVMDYILSWCLRCTQDGYILDKPILKEKCTFMLSKLLGFSLTNKTIKSVKVWKEWEHIDLCVEVIISCETGEEKHAIMIENKYYTGLKLSKDTDGEYKNQILVYKKKFDHFYTSQKNLDINKLHYCVITCIYKNDDKFHDKFGYLGSGEYKWVNVYSLCELVPDNKKTESDIYNEFLLEDWY